MLKKLILNITKVLKLKIVKASFMQRLNYNIWLEFKLMKFTGNADKSSFTWIGTDYNFQG